MSLYRPTPVLEAISDHLDAFMPEQISVEVDAGEWTTDQIVVELVGGPTVTSIHWGGHDYAQIAVQLTCTGRDRTSARLMGDLTREYLVAQDRHGSPVHPLTLAGFVFDPVESNADGFVQTGNPTSWVETYKVRYQVAA